jgi:hypothetical protein
MIINKFLSAQLNAIDKFIYLESEKAKKNLRFDDNGNATQDIFVKWIELHAEKFRNAWHDSTCRICLKVVKCYDCVKDKCEHFEQELKG